MSNYLEDTDIFSNVNNSNASINSNTLYHSENNDTISDLTQYDELILESELLGPELVDEEPKVYINKYYDVSDKVDSLEYVSKRGRKSKKINYKY